MGGSFSDPVPRDPDSGFVAVVLRSYDKVRLLDAPRSVMDMVQRIVRDLGSGDPVEYEDKHGSFQLRLPGSPFALNSGKDSSTLGKLFVLRLLEEMYILGYDLITSTDLSRMIDQATLIFKISLFNDMRSRRPMLCVAPSGSDKLVLMRCTDPVVEAVRHSIETVWSPGIQQESSRAPPSYLSSEANQFEFKLRGNPWHGDGDASTMCRQLVLQIIRSLSTLGWKLHASVNVRGGADVMYFVYDDNHSRPTSDLALLSFNRSDRIRLLNFDHQVAAAVKSTILRFHQTKEPEERDYFGAHEFKLKGYPFACSGEEAIAARQLICRLLESLRDCGWEVLTSIDISRKMNDKSVFVMGRCESAKMKYSAVAMTDIDSICLINFPQQISTVLRQVVSKNYLPGVASETSRDAGSCHEILLQGPPWSQNSSFNLHARSMVLKLIKEASMYGWHVLTSADVSAKYVHQENGQDYPVDTHTIFFSFLGLPGGVAFPRSSSALTYSELRVSDLEDVPPPPKYIEFS